MSIEIIKQDEIDKALADEGIVETYIAGLKKDYLPLKVNGVTDLEGYEKVKKARLQCKNDRVLVEKICKKGREHAIAIQKKWIAKEKEVVAQISEVENYLIGQENIIDFEKKRLAEEASKAEHEKIQERANSLAKFGVVPDIFILKDLSDADFASELEKAKTVYEKRKAEFEASEKARKEEADRLEKQKKEQEAKATELAKIEREAKEKAEKVEKERLEKEAQLRRERETFEHEKKNEADRKAREIEIEKAKKEEREKAEREAKEKVEREAKEKAEKERVEKLEKEHEEAMKPDREKLRSYRQSLLEIKYPQMSTDKFKEIMVEVVSKIEDVQVFINGVTK